MSTTKPKSEREMNSSPCAFVIVHYAYTAIRISHTLTHTVKFRDGWMDVDITHTLGAAIF